MDSKQVRYWFLSHVDHRYFFGIKALVFVQYSTQSQRARWSFWLSPHFSPPLSLWPLLRSTATWSEPTPPSGRASRLVFYILLTIFSWWVVENADCAGSSLLLFRPPMGKIMHQERSWSERPISLRWTLWSSPTIRTPIPPSRWLTTNYPIW